VETPNEYACSSLIDVLLTPRSAFEHQVLARAGATQVSAHMRRMARRRSLIVLVSFTTAMLVARASG